MFLKAFCTRAGQSRTRELIEDGRTARIYRRNRPSASGLDPEEVHEEETVWKDIVRTNVLFNFVQQLKHIGVLAPETKRHSGKINEYDPEEKPWVLREEPHN